MRSAILLVFAACGGSDTPPQHGDPDAMPPGGDAAIDTPGAANDYDSDGPVPYDVTVETVASGFDVTLYMPSTPGPHPIVALNCGTMQTAAGYASYGKRLASHGIAAVLEPDPGVLTNTSDVLPNSLLVIDTWIPSLGDKVDTTKIGLAGHSRGGAVSLLTAEHEHGKVAAWFGLDPVDNEFGQSPREFARTTIGSIGIPTAFLGAGVVSNCAPVADSYELLYPRVPSPSALIIAVDAGHVQLEDPAGCTACTICSPNGTADSATVLAYSVRYLTAFFARELLGDAAVGDAFAGAGGSGDVAAGRVTIESK